MTKDMHVLHTSGMMNATPVAVVASSLGIPNPLITNFLNKASPATVSGNKTGIVGCFGIVRFDPFT